WTHARCCSRGRKYGSTPEPPPCLAVWPPAGETRALPPQARWLEEENMGFLTGKRALIVGIASQRSIATGIAEAMHREGAEMAFTYQNDKLKSRVEEAARECGSDIVLPLDVTDDAQIEDVFVQLGKHWDGLDILVHSVGFAPREAIEG